MAENKTKTVKAEKVTEVKKEEKKGLSDKAKMWIGIGAAALILMWGVSTYNSLVAQEGQIDGMWAQVENNLQRRYDLIPNLVSTVQGYADHEEQVFTDIADARSALAGGNLSVEETAELNNQLSGSLSRLLVISEAYPELKSNENFLSLQEELAGTENRLAVARMDYNDAVKVYNVTIRTVPTNLVAGILGAQAREFFEMDAAAEENVEVNFE